jgi:hypothetical protein
MVHAFQQGRHHSDVRRGARLTAARRAPGDGSRMLRGRSPFRPLA